MHGGTDQTSEFLTGAVVASGEAEMGWGSGTSGAFLASLGPLWLGDPMVWFAGDSPT